MKAVMIGAGNIGRGFIGMLLEKAGYHVTFADVNQDVINDINTRGEYTVHMLDVVSEYTIVKNISAIHSLSPALIDEICDADLICTSVGLTALPKIAQSVALGVEKRRTSGYERSLNIIACENAVGGSSALKREVSRYLTQDALEYLNHHVGFPNCAVDRIIPPNRSKLAAEVVVEKYFEWDVERSGFVGALPQVSGMNIVDNLSAYLERKLFTLNGPNAVTACYGYLKKYKTINESLTDQEIYSVVLGMMEECGVMLSLRHGFNADEMEKYRLSLMRRFVNPFIVDDVVRVAREPIRKLSPGDRIIAPMSYAHGYGLDTPNYYTGIACVLLYDNPMDQQSQRMQELIREKGLPATLEELSGICRDSAESKAIEGEYSRLKQKYIR